MTFPVAIAQPASFWLLLSAIAAMLVGGLIVYLHRQKALERALRLRAERLVRFTDFLQELSGATSKAKTPSDVIDTCLPHVVYGVDAAAAAIVLVSDDGERGELAQAVGYDDALLAAWREFPLSGPHPLADALRRRDLVRSEAPPVPVEPRRLTSPDDAAGTSLPTIVLPLIQGGRGTGLLIVSFPEGHRAGEEALRFLQAGARRIAEALSRAQGYAQTERARAGAEELRARADEELRERRKVEQALRESETKYRALAARTRLLHELSAALSEAVTLDAVAKAIVRHGKVVVGASAGAVTLLADGGTEFETVYAEDYARRPVESWHRFPVEPGLCATAAVETRSPVFVASFAEWQERYPRSASLAADGGFVSAATLPLIVEDTAIGVQSFHFMAPVNFDDEYKALLVSLAHHCAQAIDRARLYETAQRARADAEAANRSKDDFLSTVSHELRTPLTAVLGWASMLRQGSLDPAGTTRAVEAIWSNARRQAQLIDELLDVSRIVAGRAVLDLQELDLGESIRAAVEAVLPLAEAKGLEVRPGVHPSVPVTADPQRLQQILVNLLSNAVKFTPPGGWLAVNVELSEQWVEVRVADSGSGIHPEFLPHVFERFTQAEATPSRSATGLGLGLFIARQLVEAHGGSVRAESDGPGAGSTFIVRLPVATAVQGASTMPGRAAQEPVGTAPMAADQSLDGARVLIVDDEADVRELMRVALEKSGAAVTAVGSAREALDVLVGGNVNVLLADIAMPGEDGYDLIRKVRALPVSAVSAIPAAAVTACARADERERALAAGFQMHLAKPLEPIALVHAVASLTSTNAV